MISQIKSITIALFLNFLVILNNIDKRQLESQELILKNFYKSQKLL